VGPSPRQNNTTTFVEYVAVASRLQQCGKIRQLGIWISLFSYEKHARHRGGLQFHLICKLQSISECYCAAIHFPRNTYNRILKAN